MSDATIIPSHNPLEAAIAAAELHARIVVPGVPTPTVPAAAEALGVSEDQILKSLLFVAPDGSAVLAIAAGTTRIDRAKLAAEFGVPSLKLATPDVVEQRTGYPAGGVAPVIHRERLPVIMDCRVSEMIEVYAGGGRVELLLQITPAEILRLTGGRLADIVG